MIGRSFILIAVLATSRVAPVYASPNCAAGIAAFNGAYSAWDAGGFGVAAGLFRQAATNAPLDSAPAYWLGVAEFHRMIALETNPATATNRPAIEAAREDALRALTTAVKLSQTNAEGHALLGTLYGMKIGGNVLRAARLGPRVAKHQKLALQHGAQNPRVQYLLGSCQFHTARKPADWRETLKTLETAERLFDLEASKPAGPLDPRWGRSACLTFLGRTHEKLGQRTEAGACFRKALALHPRDMLAEQGLKRVSQTP